MASAVDPEAERLLEELRRTRNRAERVRLLKALILKDGYLTDEMLEVAFARLLARLAAMK